WWDSAAAGLKSVSCNKRFASAACAFAVLAIFIIAPVALTLNSVAHSYPSLYVNVFGRNRIGYFFPHDEFYDLGARESIELVAENAPYGGTIASEIPGVVQYYLERFNRTDIHSKIISQPSFSLSV